MVVVISIGHWGTLLVIFMHYSLMSDWLLPRGKNPDFLEGYSDMVIPQITGNYMVQPEYLHN